MAESRGASGVVIGDTSTSEEVVWGLLLLRRFRWACGFVSKSMMEMF